jgi:hypothetical protein
MSVAYELVRIAVGRERRAGENLAGERNCILIEKIRRTARCKRKTVHAE